MSRGERAGSWMPTESTQLEAEMNSEAREMGDAVDDALHALAERDDFPTHEECVATLVMKCGSPQLAVRKKLYEDILVPFVPDEGFAVFQTKVERHFTKLGPSYVQERRAIYLKPSSNATQSKYLLLTKENFESALRMRWKVSKTMKTELKYEVFCYFIDTAAKGRKRKTLALQQQQMKQFQADQTGGLLVDAQANAAIVGPTLPDQAHSFLAFNAIPAAMQGYAKVAASLVESAGARKAAAAQGMRPGAAPPMPIDNTGAERPRKAARVARQTNGCALVAPLLSDSVEEPFFVPIPFRINGVELPIEIDIAALRRSLGLPPPSRVQPVSTPLSSQQPPSDQTRR